MATTNPTPALPNADAIRIAANAVARYEYGCDLNDLIPAQQHICEEFAATAIGAYLNSLLAPSTPGKRRVITMTKAQLDAIVPPEILRGPSVLPVTLDAFMALVTRWREDWLAQRLTGEEGFGDETTIEDWLGSVDAYSRVRSIVPNTSGAPPIAHGIIQCYCGVVVARCQCCKAPRQMQDGCAYCTPTPDERRNG